MKLKEVESAMYEKAPVYDYSTGVCIDTLDKINPAFKECEVCKFGLKHEIYIHVDNLLRLMERKNDK